jgi:hypothetical protein
MVDLQELAPELAQKLAENRDLEESLSGWLLDFIEGEVREAFKSLEERRKSMKNYSPIHKVYNNGIEFKKGYKASSWQGKDNGLWFTEIKKER